MEVKKSKRAAIENQRGTWLLMGFVVVLAFMFVTFEWTQHDIKVATGSLADEPVFVETLLPITYPEEKLEPPPPPVVKVAELLNIVDDDDLEAEKNVELASDDFTAIAAKILEGCGGKENIASIDNCVTRLRLEVKDMTAVNDKVIKSAGVAGVIRPGKTSVQVIVGTKVQFVADAFSRLCE